MMKIMITFFLFILPATVFGCSDLVEKKALNNVDIISFCNNGMFTQKIDRLKLDVQTDVLSISDTGGTQLFIQAEDYFGYIGQIPIILPNAKHLQSNSIMKWAGYDLELVLKKSNKNKKLWVMEARKKNISPREGTETHGGFGYIGTDTIFSTNGNVTEIIVYSSYDKDDVTVGNFKRCGKNKLNMKTLALQKNK